MDSTNSGSSSGGDEDYDFNSRSQSISSLFYSSTTAGSGAPSLSNLPPPPPQLHRHHLSPFPDTSFLDSNLAPFLDLPWSRNVRPTSSPNPNPSDLSTLILPSSSSSCTPTTSTVTQQPLQQPAPPPPDLSPASARRTSKKRSRASRREPTTVLTTDTSNFRAMVQEFTGIPAAPFASSSSFPRSRFDLFHSAATDPPAPPYLLRPFVQKAMAQPSPFLSSPAATAQNPNPNPNISTTTASNVSTNIYQLSNQSLLNNQNPNLTFHSLLQSSVSLPTMPVLASAKPQAPAIPSESNYGAGAYRDVGISTTMASSGWPAADGSDQVPSSCKMNFAVPASAEFDADKESGRTPGRSEGMMDSWICSSD